MTCGLHSKLDAAVTAVKEAIAASLEADVTDKDLDNLLCAYKGLRSVVKSTAPDITFVPDTTLGDAVTFTGDVDLSGVNIDTTNIAATNAPVTFGTDYIAGLGSDVITFGDDIDKDV